LLATLFEPLFAPAFTAWGASTSWLELIGFILALAMVAGNIREKLWAWPLAITSSALYGLLFWRSKLYGETVLQVFFIALAAWGAWQWWRGALPGHPTLAVRSLSRQALMKTIAACAILWPGLGLFLMHFTDTDVPWWDAFPLAVSVVAQILLGRKYLENWPLWAVVNLVSLGLFAYKGLWLTSVLYALFAGLSVWGWRAWRQSMTRSMG
jgi:nicotinamide mononucleotide transporter